MPRLLRDLLEQVARQQGDMDVVGSGGDAELSAAFARQVVDVVILGQDAGDMATQAQRLLAAHPGLKVVIVQNDGRFAEVIELRRLFMMEPSPQMLIHAIRPPGRSPSSSSES